MKIMFKDLKETIKLYTLWKKKLLNINKWNVGMQNIQDIFIQILIFCKYCNFFILVYYKEIFFDFIKRCNINYNMSVL